MWGCIVEPQAKIIKKGVPSLYVRVYRGNVWSRLKLSCSLTVCEGVSDEKNDGVWLSWFPHCMWGCIDSISSLSSSSMVPSLYVRVYRHFCCSIDFRKRSVTVCEGVSDLGIQTQGDWAFPHCMWGCIGWKPGSAGESGVPSLYVRVYRCSRHIREKTCCSLTVCEGVSRLLMQFLKTAKFPHYMWGCIAAG